jgi:hypothetical protein
MKQANDVKIPRTKSEMDDLHAGFIAARNGAFFDPTNGEWWIEGYHAWVERHGAARYRYLH